MFLNSAQSKLTLITVCILFALICLPAALAQTSSGLTIDTQAFGDSQGGSSVSTGALTTQSANDVLLAFISSDGPSGATTSVTGVTGGGLTWQLVQRTNVQAGTAEIWRAFAPAILSNAVVSANLQYSGAASITVLGLSGAETSGTYGSGAIGAVASANAPSGAPTASLVTTRNNSWVFGVGSDWDNATARTLGPAQTLVHQFMPTVGDTYWVQSQTAPTPSQGTQVTINDTAPAGDRYNLSLVEVVPSTGTSAPGVTISGTVSPAANGAGTTVTMSGAGNGSVVADASGNFNFSNVASGTYTLTPSKSGFTFNPTSASVTVNSANVTGINFTATAVQQQTWSLSGTLSPASMGASATVTLGGISSATTTADTNGNYTFTGLANGTYQVTPSKSGTTFTPANRSITVNGANVTSVNFTASINTGSAWSITGSITPASIGAGATVGLSGTSTGSTTADANGNYTFTGLVNGSYTIRPKKSGVTFKPYRRSVTVNNADVTVAAFTASGGTTSTWSISGSITPGSNGAGATVTLGGASAATTTADANGNYVFSGLVNGTYSVTPSKSGYTFSPTGQSVTVNGANATAGAFTAAVVTSSHSVDISWTASTSSSVAGYKVYRATVSGGPYVVISSAPVTSTMFTDLNVGAGTTYYYVVTAVDSSGTESTYSNEATAAVPIP